VRAAVAFGKRVEVGEQCDGGVVLCRFAGGDHFIDARPRGVFGAGKLVQSLFAGEGTCLRVARFLVSSSGGCLALSVGPSPCCAVEEICHGPAGWVGDVRGVFVAESAKYLHPHGHSVIFDDPQ
jgi:hypothetical protein